jgi:hypothetical protein
MARSKIEKAKLNQIRDEPEFKKVQNVIESSLQYQRKSMGGHVANRPNYTPFHDKSLTDKQLSLHQMQFGKTTRKNHRIELIDNPDLKMHWGKHDREQMRYQRRKIEEWKETLSPRA